MLVLKAKKKRLGALIATQKKHRSLPSTVSEKSRKTSKNANLPQKCLFWGYFGGFS